LAPIRKMRQIKLTIFILLFFISTDESYAQPGIGSFPAYFEKTLITENGKTIDASKLTVEIRYAYYKVDSASGILLRSPITWKAEHPVQMDTLYIQRIPGIHSYLITLNGTETKIYFPTNNIPYTDASIYDFEKYSLYKRLFAEKIADPLNNSNKEIALINVTCIIEWNELETYDAETHDRPPNKARPIPVNQVTKKPIVPNNQNTIQKPDSVIQVLFRNSNNELIQDCRISLLLDAGKVVPLELISCDNYCYYLMPDGYRKRSERYQRIIVFHEDYLTDTFHINIGNQQFYLFKEGEPWICMSNKIPYRNPTSEYMLAVRINSTISFDSLAHLYDLTIDSLLMDDPFGGDGLNKAYCSFKSHVDEDAQRKAVIKINQDGRIIFPLVITYIESYEHIVSLGNEVSVLFENNIDKETVLGLLRGSGLESPIDNYPYYEGYKTAQATIPQEWGIEKIRLTLNHLHNKSVFLRVGISFSE
jgi:hypothetical protein